MAVVATSFIITFTGSFFYPMLRLKKAIIFSILGIFSLGLFAFQQDNLFEISKHIDIFTTLFRELNATYVDDFSVEKITSKGIEAMLESLDPYTEYIPDSEVKAFKLSHVSNEYAGIGALVQEQEGKVVIAEPYFKSPAQKAGLMAGDVVLKVDEQEVKNYKLGDVTELMKGPLNSKVKLTISRPGESMPIIKTITREAIKIHNISYSGTIAPGIGYIKLDKFLDNSAAEFKQALIQLKQKSAITGLIIDLRDNGGGMLMEAVKIVNLFVPKGSLIVSQKGKDKATDMSYYANLSPVDTSLSIAVLIDEGTASASEVVAGAIQDTDRGVVIGQRSYGKGLVQQTYNLSYNALVKITIAKYYTPSGRCLQAIDYSKKNGKGKSEKVNVADMLEFKTRHGRSIYDGSGVFPDIVTELQPFDEVVFHLAQKHLIFNYATQYRLKHQSIATAKQFEIADDDYQNFMNYVAQEKFSYQTDSEKQLEILEKASQKENYHKNLNEDYIALKENIEKHKKTNLIRYKVQIKQVLESEIAARYFYQDGRAEASFKYDNEFKTALELLQNKQQYSDILSGKGHYEFIGKPSQESTTADANNKTEVKEEEQEGE